MLCSFRLLACGNVPTWVHAKRPFAFFFGRCQYSFFDQYGFWKNKLSEGFFGSYVYYIEVNFLGFL